MPSADSAMRNCATPIETVTLDISSPVVRRVNRASPMRGRMRSATAAQGSNVAPGSTGGRCFATVTRGVIAIAHALLQDLGDQTENLIADLMAVAVVELLEVVDIDHQDA